MKAKKICLFGIMLFALGACKKDNNGSDNPGPGLPPLLKDVSIQNLPPPTYHFEYDAGRRVIKQSIESGLANYEVDYQGTQISRIRNIDLVNKDELEYVYENGRVSLIKYLRESGTHYKSATITYDAGKRLSEIVWTNIDAGGQSTFERSLRFSYYPDNNLKQRIERIAPVNPSDPETNITETYENYDRTPNVDGFSLIHKLGTHLFLLPEIVLQINNPLKMTSRGNSTNYDGEFVFAYGSNGYPLSKSTKYTFFPSGGGTSIITGLTSYNYYP